MEFNEIGSNEPPRYTELCETINKAFVDISDSISPEEFKNILGDISFLKSQKNVANLLFTLKTHLSNTMNKYFKQIIEEENLLELFTKKNSLNDEVAKKYLDDGDSLELIELEEYLNKLNAQIADLEEKNGYLFDQGKFNEQRFEQLSDRLTHLIIEYQTKYNDCIQQIDIIKNELTNTFEN